MLGLEAGLGGIQGLAPWTPAPDHVESSHEICRLDSADEAVRRGAHLHEEWDDVTGDGGTRGHGGETREVRSPGHAARHSAQRSADDERELMMIHAYQHYSLHLHKSPSGQTLASFGLYRS
jgi:hypothetical protein